MQKYTKEQYRKNKSDIMQKIILHKLDPEHFGSQRLTLEETALLLSKSENSIPSKMAICKIEKSALKKLGSEMNSRFGMSSISDFLGNSNQRPSISYGAI